MDKFLTVVFIFVLAGGAVYLYFKYGDNLRKKLSGIIEVAPEKAFAVMNIFNHGVQLCEEEVFVRAYNCARLKSVFLRVIKADGILTITSKRVIFHTIGIKNNDDFIHHEVPIEDVSGISVQSGIAKETALTLLSPLLALMPGGKMKKIFFLDIHAKGAGKEGIINIAPTDAKGMTVAMPSYDMIPTPIVVEMANEIGAIISDIQKLGDIGVEKWKQG